MVGRREKESVVWGGGRKIEAQKDRRKIAGPLPH